MLTRNKSLYLQVYCKEDDDGLNTDDDLDPIKEDLVGEATALPASPGKSDGDEKAGESELTENISKMG